MSSSAPHYLFLPPSCYPSVKTVILRRPDYDGANSETFLADSPIYQSGAVLQSQPEKRSPILCTSKMLTEQSNGNGNTVPG